MIKFFRKIRQRLLSENKFSKYLIYAIGEIALVMIGILLALQVNNKNELRKARETEIKLFKNTIQDLELSSRTNEIQIKWFKYFQDLHYKIYKQTKGELEFDPEQDYNDLLWSNFFRPLIQENYADKVGSISNELIQKLFRDHIWREELTLEAMKEWNDHKYGVLRPYFNEHGINDTENIFNDKPYEFMSLGETSLIREESLYAVYGTEEFDQLLYDLRFKASWVLHCMKNLQIANQRLNEALDAYVIGDYEKLEQIEPLQNYY